MKQDKNKPGAAPVSESPKETSATVPDAANLPRNPAPQPEPDAPRIETPPPPPRSGSRKRRSSEKVQPPPTQSQLKRFRLQQKHFRYDIDTYMRTIICVCIVSFVIYWYTAVLSIMHNNQAVNVTQEVAVARVHSDAVLIALLGTTTANVVGLWYVIARHLFPQLHTLEDRQRGSTPPKKQVSRNRENAPKRSRSKRPDREA
jgi:hypothetical protein